MTKEGDDMGKTKNLMMLAFTGRDPSFGEKMRIHLRRTSANARFTLGLRASGADSPWTGRSRRKPRGLFPL